MKKNFESLENSLRTKHDTKEQGNFTFLGETFDTITYPDGRVEKRERSFNIVVDSISKLISALIKNDSAYAEGNLYWAVGTGQSTWDTAPYNPVSTNTKLINEVFRKRITKRTFIDSAGNPTAIATNRLQLEITVESSEANGLSLREFGIFGGNVTGTKDSGVMINHKIHSRIDKEEGMIVERSVRFTF